jgi:hypothetical protein
MIEVCGAAWFGSRCVHPAGHDGPHASHEKGVTLSWARGHLRCDPPAGAEPVAPDRSTADGVE